MKSWHDNPRAMDFNANPQQLAQIAIYAQTFAQQYMDAVQKSMAKLTKTMRFWFPNVREAHRAEVRLVHTQYDRKRRSRKRRNR